MTGSVARISVALAWLAFLASACTVDRSTHPNYGCGDRCPKERCYKGFCLPDNADAGADLGDGGSVMGTRCDEDGKTDFCYEGKEGTATLGRCRAGTRTCLDGTWGPCVGQVMPAETEACNAIDDDCDGSIDEDLVLGSCQTGSLGLCAAGLMQCASGLTICVQVTPAGLEACDAQDNDCDGKVDEDISTTCYTGTAGCTVSGSQATCVGICKTGQQECVDGQLTPCAGEVTPQDEVCTSPGELAVDEDCDGVADEDCACNDGDTQDCYGGPEGTDQRLPCKRGSQACEKGKFGSCEGAVLPTAETCANENEDNDCNGIADDVPLRASPCAVLSNAGDCRFGAYDCVEGELRCVTPEPGSIPEACNNNDEDCDGRVDEDFDLSRDSENCGECGRRCGAGTSCCGGECVSLSEDEGNCGECGKMCGNGLTCCNGMCVNLQTNVDNCGACGNVCPGLLGIRTCRANRCSTL